MPFAAISGVGAYLPKRRLTNADLEDIVDTTDEWILTRTGISERRLAADDEATSDLAACAAVSALTDAGTAPADVDLLVLATSSPDMIFPSSACLAAAKIGLDCPAFDVNAACTGFVYALQVGAAAIESGRAKTVLVAGADALTRHVDFTDRTTCVLFGDGAGAVVLTASTEPGVLGIDLGADGRFPDILRIPAGGSAAPCTPDRLAAREQYLVMNGNEVFKFAVRAIPKTVRRALKASRLTIADVHRLVPHQANQRIIDTIADRLAIDHERVVSTIHETGNTSTASIPLALHALYTRGDLTPGQVVVLVGFGAGLTWGAAVVRWTSCPKAPEEVA